MNDDELLQDEKFRDEWISAAYAILKIMNDPNGKDGCGTHAEYASRLAFAALSAVRGTI